MDSWIQCIRRGDFDAAWQISDAVLRSRAGQPCWHLPRHQQYLWNGEPLAGKRVLIRCYHGLGDTIQFIRYVPLIRERAREVIVWAQPGLVEILRSVDGVDRVLALHDGDPGVSHDMDVEIMELPHLFRSNLSTLPCRVPYLRVPSAGFSSLPFAGSECHVGVVWRAGDWDTERSVPLPLLASLGTIPGVVLHSLQRGSAAAEWRTEFGSASGTDDVIETARLMNALDLIISVDSFPAHLAGALARPVWTLLHSQPDWRWMEARDDSPWYPTMRLFRQERAGEWEPVIARMGVQLWQLASLKI